MLWCGPMTKKLSLFRHAKSDWADAALQDIERPLNDRGRRDAPAMGAYMAKQEHIPDLILCSAATRTKETAALIMEAFAGTVETDAPTKIDTLQRLYLATPGDILHILSALPDDVKHVMIIAHNPGLHSLAITLGHEAFPGKFGDLIWKFPTAALAVFECEAQKWAELTTAPTHLVDYMIPKNLS